MKSIQEKMKEIEIIQKNCVIEEPYLSYFNEMIAFIKDKELLFQTIAKRDWKNVSLEELQEENLKNYIDILPENYTESYANPEVAYKRLDRMFGPMLSYIYTDLRKLIPITYEQNKAQWVMQVNLFIEFYREFNEVYKATGKRPTPKMLEDIIYWNRTDYMEVVIPKALDSYLDSLNQWVVNKIMTMDLKDERYLYVFGDYVTKHEVQMAKHIMHLSEDTIAKMADTFTEGYRIGFVNKNVDLSKKKTTEIICPMGFEIVIKKAIANLEAMGLTPTIRHAAVFGNERGFLGANPNRQFTYDHKEDDALYLDKVLNARKLEIYKAAFENRKKMAAVYAGPAVMQVFGQEPFTPVNKEENVRYSDVQQKHNVEYMTKAGKVTNEYIKGEERSFTIIAFPTPEIGEQFEEIFDETIKLNTLDYKLYESMQQKIIEVLDTASKVHILGKDGNQTDITVKLASLRDASKETIFENCVADVNIPVGEVFTSPVLEGTNGVLHVKSVYLKGLQYKNLTLTFEDGMIKAYSCSNFDKDEENKGFIKENLLHYHDTLPLGEFAIGTNTTAYVMANKYDIADKLPILIAEKMGPHFAVGDTCFSHSEDIPVFNPNGKEIIARENSVSALRNTKEESKAYLNCHTDITIPYEELGGLWAVKEDGEKIAIIEDGMFVLSGIEALNDPFRQND